MLASLTLDVITTFVCNTGKTNHQMNKFITLYERMATSRDLQVIYVTCALPVSQ